MTLTLTLTLALALALALALILTPTLTLTLTLPLALTLPLTLTRFDLPAVFGARDGSACVFPAAERDHAGHGAAPRDFDLPSDLRGLSVAKLRD